MISMENVFKKIRKSLATVFVVLYFLRTPVGSKELTNKVSYHLEFVENTKLNPQTRISKVVKRPDHMSITVCCDPSVYAIAESAKNYADTTDDKASIFTTTIVSLNNTLFAILTSESFESDTEDDSEVNKDLENIRYMLYYYYNNSK